MRKLEVSQITQAVKQLCIETNRILPADLEQKISKARQTEQNATGRAVLEDLYRNMNAAREMQIPICQDTGMAVIFAEIGQDVHLVGGCFEEAVNEGVRQGYLEGLLRLSVVGDPLERKNTNDNTPAIIHTKLIAGDKVSLTVAPKGFGSENMSRINMFTPSATKEDIIAFVVETAKLAGSNACPPMVLGVGIGGDFELCAYLAKKALCREISQSNPKEEYRLLEQEMLKQVNQLHIGPQGFGGSTTALHVAIEQYATHIAGLPVAVNVGCHVTRHKKITI